MIVSVHSRDHKEEENRRLGTDTGNPRERDSRFPKCGRTDTQEGARGWKQTTKSSTKGDTERGTAREVGKP